MKKLIHLLTSVRLYPFLFALYATIHYFSYDLHKAPLSFVITLLIAWLITAVFALIASIFLKDRQKKSLFTFFLTITFFSYGQFINFASEQAWHLPLHSLPLAFLLLVLGVVLIRLRRQPHLDQSWGSFLTVAVLTMVTYSSWISLAQAITDVQEVKSANNSLITLSGTVKPDIYYLVFDDYGGKSALQKAFNYDNSSFLTQLQQRDFYVASKSTANYNGSLHSLASTLNLNYLAPLTAGTTSTTDPVLFYKNLVENNQVSHALQATGYQTYHLGSWFEYTRFDHNATYNDYPTSCSWGIPCYSLLFLTDTTAIQPWQAFIFPTIHRSFAEYQIKKLPQIASQPSASPKFVFAHILLPHGPNVYKANCQPGDNGYTAQLSCTNSQLLSIIDQIKKNAKTPPIIILQSDEGTDQEEESASSTNWSDEALQERFPLLAAYYFPDQDYHALYPSFTPVNAFRLVFQQYLHASTPLLPDRNYLMPEYTQLKGELDITKRLNSLLP